LATKKHKQVAGLILKLALSILGIVWAYSRINIQQLSDILYQSQYHWLAPALIFYVLSKIISSFRLTTFFHQTGVKISQIEGMRLYWVGMFYNLFLPGGIGGDAYKVVLLNKYRKAKWKSTTGIVLYDRLTGLLALVMICGLFIPILFPHIWVIGIFISLFALLSGFLFTYFFFKKLMQTFVRATILSILLQSIQIGAAWMLFMALHSYPVDAGYLFLFLVSSVVSVLPISIGGIGAREFAFVWGASYLNVSSEICVAFALLFFLITACASLPGGFVREKNIFHESDIDE